MTSVPKPLKFLLPHYTTLTSLYEKWPLGKDAENKRDLADILSVLAMTMSAEGKRESLNFKLAGNRTDLGRWGHEYLRCLAGEIGQEYTARVTAVVPEGQEDGMQTEPEVQDLMALVDEIVPFHLQHNAEAEAIDLLVEVQCLKKLLDLTYVDEKNYHRICLYLLRMADYMADPDDLSEMMAVAFELYRKQSKFCDALRVALRMDDLTRVSGLLEECSDEATRKQIALIIGRHSWVSHLASCLSRSMYEHPDQEALNELGGNSLLSEHFLHLARDLDVMEPKAPEDIYKSHLAETGGFTRRRDTGAQQVDSARANLASTFVNAFVNAGYGKDSLMTVEGNSWLYKNKDHGMMSASASLGMILLWNVEEGLTQIDKFLYSSEEFIKAGAALAVGIVSSGIRNDSDPALALLSEHVEGGSHVMKCAAAVGLGIAYAGARRDDVMELLTPLVSTSADDKAASMVEVGLASLSLGLIFVGTCNEEVGSMLVQRLMEASDTELDQGMARFVSLGLGLLFLGKMEKVDAMLEVVRTLEHKLGKFTQVVLESCAYTATGNVLKVQSMLHMCAEHLEENAEHQMAAVLGIALVSMGDSVGSEMALRTFDHLLHYGELPIKRTIPLALALMHLSNPDYGVIDQLSRLTHDGDAEVAQNAIIGLGLSSAGTNNSRVAQLLRQLSEFYSREASHLFCTRLAQGLNHMGKGLLTLHPFHSDRLIMSPVALGSVLIVLHACLDMKSTLLDKYHYLMYFLTPALAPRMLMTVDEDLKPLAVNVRVGQAVETVGQAGRPKTITGFQTHTTPVLLSVKDRAELAGTEYIAVGSVLEGVVILQPNPEEAEEKEK
ncbi:unnamed protein product [Chrysoparadoxa australica]